MNKALKWLFIIFGVVVILVVVAVIVLPMVVDVNQYKPQIEAQVAKATGRDFRLGDDLALSVFPWVGVKLSDLHLGNPAGFKEKDFVSVAAFEVRVKVLPLLSRSIEVNRFVLHQPVIVMEKRKDGKGGWEGLGQAVDSAKPPEKKSPSGGDTASTPVGELPIKGIMVDEFAITDGLVVWLDQASGTRKEIKKINLTLNDVSLDKPIRMAFSALADEKPIALDGAIGPLGTQPGRQPMPLDLVLKLLDEMDVKLNGRIDPSGTVPTFDLALDVVDFSPRKLLAKLGQALPFEPADAGVLNAVGLSFGVKGSTEGMAVSDGKLKLDDTRATFSAKASEFSKPNLKFEMRLDSIDLDRYLPAPAEGKDGGAKQPSSQTETAANKSVPAKKTDYGPLRRLVLDARFDAGALKVQKARMQNLTVRVTARSGIVKLDPMKLDLYGGNLAGNGQFDVRQATPSATVQMNLDGVQAGPMIKDLMQKEMLEGAMAADIGLNFTGDTPEQIRQTLGGKGNLQFTDGAIVGIDLASMVRNVQTVFGLAEKTTEKPRTDFSELQMPYTMEKGLFKTDATRLVSPLLRILVAGNADLSKETLDFKVTPKFVATIKGQGDTAERSGIMVPVLVAGSFAEPTFTPDLKSILNQDLPTKEQVQQVKEDLKKLIPENKEDRQKMIEEGVKGLLKGFGSQ